MNKFLIAATLLLSSCATTSQTRQSSVSTAQPAIQSQSTAVQSQASQAPTSNIDTAKANLIGKWKIEGGLNVEYEFFADGAAKSAAVEKYIPPSNKLVWKVVDSGKLKDMLLNAKADDLVFSVGYVNSDEDYQPMFVTRIKFTDNDTATLADAVWGANPGKSTMSRIK